jgi:hypothetical protein
MCTCIGTSLTTAADWEFGFTDFGGVTGTGNVVLATSPTIATPTVTTSAVIPLINGGTTASSTLTLQSTSGAGTTDAILFKTASQAEKMRLDTSGNLVLGNTTALAKIDVGPVDSADEGGEIRLRGATNGTMDYYTDVFQSAMRFVKVDKGTASTNAAVRFQIGSSGEWGIGGAGYGTSGQTYISGGTGAAPSWGTLGVAGGGTGITTATAYSLIAAGTTSTGAFQSVGTGTARQVLSSGGSSALPSWVQAGAVYLGQGVGNTVSFTSLGTYSKFIAFVAIGTNSSSNRNATAAVSSDNGSTYSNAKQITPSVISTGASFAYGTVEISGVGVVGNKTYTPASVSTNQNSYSTVSTETTVTGVTNALQFDRTGTGTTITVILFGVP